MEVNWVYSACDKQDEEHIEACWERIQPELEANLGRLDDDPIELGIAVYHEDSPPEWQIQAALHLPGRTLVTEVGRNRVENALDDILSGLIEEIDALEEEPVEQPQRVEGLEAIVPLLERSHHEGHGDAFFTFLAPVVAAIDPYAERELRIREAEGMLPSGQIARTDLLDEVLLRAYTHWKKRPGQLPLDLWLIQLAEEVLGELGRAPAAESLEAEIPEPSTEPRASEEDSWVEQATYPETAELGDLLPGLPGADAWDSLDMETKQMRMDALLAKLTRKQRQALVLNSVHGYSTAEIADFQGRSQEDIEIDIAAARETLQHHFVEETLVELEDEYRKQ